MSKVLTHDRLLELLHYDPQTGIFTRLVKTGGHDVGTVAGSKHSKGYVELRVNGRSYLAHRLAWFYMTREWPAGKLDHRNTIRNHNWFDNLRPATDQQNSMNTNKYIDNKSGFKGVSFHKKANKFRATIYIDKKQKHLGFYKTAEEASEAYIAASRQHHKEFHHA